MVTQTDLQAPSSSFNRYTVLLSKALPLILSLSGFVGMGLIWLSTSRYGVGCTPDSADYIAAARSFLSGKGFAHWEGKPFTSWPPLFPIVLSALGFLGIDPLLGARLLNMFCFGGMITSVGWMAMRLIPNPWVVLIAIGAALLMPAISAISMMALSEPLFLLLSLWTIWFLPKFFVKPTLGGALVAGGFCGLAILTRNIGITLWIVGVGMMGVFPTGMALRKRLGSMAVFSGVSLGPYALWSIRNTLISGTVTGGRESTEKTFLQNLRYIIEIFAEWTMPERLPFAIQLVGVLVIGSIVIWAALQGFQSWTDFDGFRVYAGTFIAFYTILLWILASLIEFDYLKLFSGRLLMPVYMPALLLFFMGMSDLLRRDLKSAGASTFLWVGAWGLMLIPLALGAKRTISQTRVCLKQGIAGSYQSTRWAESPVTQWVSSTKPQGRVISNHGDLLYLYCGVPAKEMTRKGLDIAAFLKNTPCRRCRGFIRWKLAGFSP